ncbi:MFS transporter, partial [Acinetobacter baumannii]
MGKNIRWIIVLLLFLVYMINYLDRVALSIT